MSPLLIHALLRYGHLLTPFGRDPISLPKPLDKLTIADDVIIQAIASFQDFYGATLEPLVAAFEPRKSPRVRNDGTLDRATETLLGTARCECPDYGEEMLFRKGASADAALGRGNWARCNGAENHHRVVARFLNEPPAFLSSVWSQVWTNVCEAYAEIGLEILRNDTATHANIDVSFVRPNGSWIGLAIVGNGVACGDTIWAQFDQNYRPGNLISEWTTLICHEFGHNCGLEHSKNGKMNAFLIAGLPTSWRGDPSHPLLVERFGGERIPSSTPPDRELVFAWRDRRTGAFELASTIPTQPGVWPT